MINIRFSVSSLRSRGDSWGSPASLSLSLVAVSSSSRQDASLQSISAGEGQWLCHYCWGTCRGPAGFTRMEWGAGRRRNKGEFFGCRRGRVKQSTRRMLIINVITAYMEGRINLRFKREIKKILWKNGRGGIKKKDKGILRVIKMQTMQNMKERRGRGRGGRTSRQV